MIKVGDYYIHNAVRYIVKIVSIQSYKKDKQILYEYVDKKQFHMAGHHAMDLEFQMFFTKLNKEWVEILHGN